MANATRILATYEIKKVQTTPGSVTLELSENEALFLAVLLAKVGGSPEYSIRKYQQPITTALASVGVHCVYPTSQYRVSYIGIMCGGDAVDPYDFKDEA